MAPKKKDEVKDAPASAADENKSAADLQNEAFGGVDAILDPGAGYPQVTGKPSQDAMAGTPLDPHGAERIAAEAGRTPEAVEEARGSATPIHLDDPESVAKANEEALEKGGGNDGIDKAVRGPKDGS